MKKRQHVMPKWLCGAIRKAGGTENFRGDNDLNHPWFDHWGTIPAPYKGLPERVLVSEPYHITPESMKAIIQFAARHNLVWDISGGAEHHPTCCRLIFWPRWFIRKRTP